MILLKSVGFYWLICLQKQGYPHVGCVTFLTAPLCHQAQISGGRLSSDLFLSSNRVHSPGRHKQPWLFLRTEHSGGAGSQGNGSMSPSCLLLWGFWRQHPSPAPVSPVPDAFLGSPHRAGLNLAPDKSPPPRGQQDQQLRHCSVFAGEGRAVPIKLYFRPSHVISGLLLLPQDKDSLPCCFLKHPWAQLWCWQLPLFCCPLLSTLWSVFQQESPSQELSALLPFVFGCY